MNIRRKKPRNEILRKDGLFYHPSFVKKTEREEVINWLKTLYPIWEMRYSEHNPPPEGDEQRAWRSVVGSGGGFSRGRQLEGRERLAGLLG